MKEEGKEGWMDERRDRQKEKKIAREVGRCWSLYKILKVSCADELSKVVGSLYEGQDK